VIEIRTIPVRVADLIERAGSDQKLSIVCVRVGERLAELVKEECEPAFQPARDIWMRPLPRAPLGKCPNARQIVTVRKLFEKKVASGVDDSPMANRGCRPRSISTT